MRQAVNTFQPDYLAIGIEANVPLDQHPDVWNAYIELHKHVYAQLKSEFPDLPIFATFTLHHLRGLDGGNAINQYQTLTPFMDYNDILGISAYPHGWYHATGKEDPIPDDFFEAALAFNMPIAITETGAPSQSFHTLGMDYTFDEQYQRNYIDFLLQQAAEYQFEFVVNWAAIDIDKLIQHFPSEAKEIALVWAYIGLQRSDDCQKTALHLWDDYLEIPFSP